MDHHTERDDEFADFVAGHWQRLLRSAVLLGCTLGEAEDLAQTTLVRCYAKWPLVLRAENRTAYVARVLLNEHRATRRRRSSGERPVVVVPDRSTDDDETDRVVAVDAVRRALAGLTGEQREVVLLRYYLQLSERECADALRVPPGTVKSRLSRALRALAGSVELAAFRTEGDLP